MRYLSFLIIFLFSSGLLPADDDISQISVVRLKYNGGGDWYGNKTTFINLFKRMHSELRVRVPFKENHSEIMEKELFNYPIAYLTGDGNIRFSDEEAARLRRYLTSGGFLFADDDYGMDIAFRREMKKVFPELKFVELPFRHPIYNIYFDFPNGLPKIHEHDQQPATGWGISIDGRLVLFYLYESDIGDGWEDSHVHNDSPEKRLEALKMGLNIVAYSMAF